MLTNRLTRLTTALADQALDAVVIVPGANLRYLLNVSFHPSKRLTLALFPAAGGRPGIVLPALELGGVRAQLGDIAHFYPWTDAAGPTTALLEAVGQVFRGRRARIAVEHTVMRVMELRALENAGRQLGVELDIVDATPLLAQMRMVKDADEQAAMAEAARIVEQALRNTIAQIKQGVTERQLSHICTQEIMAAGAEGESFDNLIASGPHSANPHHNVSDRAFQPGDLIVLDCGAVYRGYASDITRTVALAEPTPEARHIYQTVLAANTAARNFVRPGVTGEQIDRAARDVIAAAGYGDFFLHRTGHGLGLEINPCHEPPDLVAGSNVPFAVGTTFTIEPGIYIEGMGGVRIEDDVVITEAGCQSFTTFDRELMIVPV